IVSYNVIISVGFILIAVAVMEKEAMEGAVFYLIHDMYVKALLFLLAGATIFVSRTPRYDEISGLIRHYPVLGWSFFITILALAGLPPLSGFLGKMLIAQGALANGSYLLLALGIFSSFVALYSLLRVFMHSFWGETIIDRGEATPLSKKLRSEERRVGNCM